MYMDVYIDTHMCEQCMKNNSSVTYTFNYLMSTIESVSKHTHRIMYVYIYIYVCIYLSLLIYIYSLIRHSCSNELVHFRV